MEFDVLLSPDDYRRALFLHSRLTHRSTILLSTAALALLAAAIAIYPIDSSIGLLLPTPVLVFLIVRTMMRFVFIPGGALHAYSEQRLLHTTHRYSLTESGLSSSSEYGQGTIPWDHFVKWKADSQLVLLYTTPSHFIVIPRRSVRGDSEQRSLTDLFKRVGIAAA